MKSFLAALALVLVSGVTFGAVVEDIAKLRETADSLHSVFDRLINIAVAAKSGIISAENG